MLASSLLLFATLNAIAITASPTRTLNARQGLSSGAVTVNDNISGWQGDIANVNTFLDDAAAGNLPGTALAQTASELLVNQPGNAADEPNRLMALTPLIATSNTMAEAAATDLGNIFGGVLGNLTIIMQNANNIDIINSAVEQINCLRCNFVLPDIDLVYAGAVANNPGAISATTSGPKVCPNPFDGSFTCNGLALISVTQ